MNQRQIKGKQITEKQNQIIRIDETHYKVNSQSRDKQHDVVSLESGWSCSGEGRFFRKTCCKHIHAVEISLKIRKTVVPKIISFVETNCCVYCKSDNIKKAGIHHNKNQDIQMYTCKNKSCKRKFSINLGFENMHATPQVITSAMQLYFAGESYRNIEKFLNLQGTRFSHVAIYEWLKKYIELMDSYLEPIVPQVGDKWHADEVWLRVKGDRKYLFAMMDNDTRFWISQEVADSKFKHDAQGLLKKGKQLTKKIPSVFVTDGLLSYNDAFKKESAPKNFLYKDSKHIKEIHFKNQRNNNNIEERLNGEFLDRAKTFRGLKKDDSPSIAGIRLYHNYLRPHSSLNNDTPADRAGVKIEGEKKWKTIIENASKQK